MSLDNYLYKICFTMTPKQAAFGGGNQFLLNFVDYLTKQQCIKIVYDLTDDDIDVIFIMDPRKLTLNKVTLDMVIKYKKKHPNIVVIHRVNDCDLPRNHVDVLDPLILKSLKDVTNVPVFVSNFTKEYFTSKGFSGQSFVILNGCNTKHFYPKKDYVQNKKIKIMTHHWSNNFNKGFEFYNALDEFVGKHPKYEFIYVGRQWADGYVPKNSKIIGPFYGNELGDILRSADIYVTGAHYENCPFHVVEALSTGLPMLYYSKLGGGLELCKKTGEEFTDVKSMFEKLELISKNIKKYRNKINTAQLDSSTCNKQYENVILGTLLKTRYKIKDVKLSPLWFKKLILWCIKIEQSNYSWSLTGFNEHKLGAVGLFAKLAKIFGKYYNFNIKNITDELNKFYKNKMYIDIEKEKVAETRQAISGLINLNHEIPEINVDTEFKEPLYFMTDKQWVNPWGAGAHLSHYLFFMKLLKRKDKIELIMEQLKKYEKPNGWYHGKPNKHYIINGIMKVFTGFDIVNEKPLLDDEYTIKLSNVMANNIIDEIIQIDDSFGGCGIYDYVYVLTKCMDNCNNPDKIEKCKDRLQKVYTTILKHQQSDGGFKYEITTDKAHKYYGEEIVPNGMIGNIHGTTLFCMALSRLDKYLNLGLKMNLAIS